jgi:hypothetical protein
MYSSVDLYTLMYKCEIANGRVPCHLEILAGGFDLDYTSIFARGMTRPMHQPLFPSLDGTHSASPLLLPKANHTSNICRVRPIVCYGCYLLL